METENLRIPAIHDHAAAAVLRGIRQLAQRLNVELLPGFRRVDVSVPTTVAPWSVTSTGMPSTVIVFRVMILSFFGF
nr:hypothetical protein [Sinorhizobium arboris]